MSYDIDMIPEKVIRLSKIYVPRHVRRSHSRTQEEGWLVHPTLLASSRTPPVAPLPPYQLSAPSSTSSGRPCPPPAGGGSAAHNTDGASTSTEHRRSPTRETTDLAEDGEPSERLWSRWRLFFSSGVPDQPRTDV